MPFPPANEPHRIGIHISNLFNGSSTLHKENIIEFINLTMTLLISVIIFVYLSSSEHQLLKSRISFCRLIPRSCEASDSHLSVLRCKCLMCQQIRKNSDCLFTEGMPDQQAESEDQHEACTFTLLKGTRLESTSGARYLPLGERNEARITQCQ